MAGLTAPSARQAYFLGLLKERVHIHFRPDHLGRDRHLHYESLTAVVRVIFLL
jgi:hypothetical protein